MDEFTQHCLLPTGKSVRKFTKISTQKQRKEQENDGQEDFPNPIKCRRFLTKNLIKFGGRGSSLVCPMNNPALIRITATPKFPPSSGGRGPTAKIQNAYPIGSCPHPVMVHNLPTTNPLQQIEQCRIDIRVKCKDIENAITINETNFTQRNKISRQQKIDTEIANATELTFGMEN